MSARPIETFETFNLRERIDISPAAKKAAKAPIMGPAAPAALPAKLKVQIPTKSTAAPTAAPPKPPPLPFLAATNNTQFKFLAAKTAAAQPDSPSSAQPTPAPCIETPANNGATLRLAAQLEDMTGRHQRAQKLVESNAANLRQTATILITERKEHQLAISRLQAELATAAEVESRLKAQLAERPAKSSFNDAVFASKVQAAVEEENAVTSKATEIAELTVKLTTLADRKVLLAAEISALETLRDAASTKLDEIRSEHRNQKAITDQCGEEHKVLVAEKATLVKEVAVLKAQGVNQVQINEDLTLLAINEQVATARAELLRMDKEQVKRSRRVVAAEDVWEAAGHVAAISEEVEQMEAPPLSPVPPRAPQAFEESVDQPVEVVVHPTEPPFEAAATELAPSPTSALVEPVDLMEAPVETLRDEPVLTPTEALLVVTEAPPPPTLEELVTEADLIELEREVTAVEAEVAMEKMETLEMLMPELQPPLPPPLLPLSSMTASKTNISEAVPVAYTPISRPKSICHLMPKVAKRSGIAVHHLPIVKHTMGTGEFESTEDDSNALVEAVIYDLRARFSA